MTQFLVAESLKNSTYISEHKVPVSSQIFDHNFLTLIVATYGLHHGFQYNFLYKMRFKYGIHNKYFNFHLSTLLFVCLLKPLLPLI